MWNELLHEEDLKTAPLSCHVTLTYMIMVGSPSNCSVHSWKVVNEQDLSRKRFSPLDEECYIWICVIAIQSIKGGYIERIQIRHNDENINKLRVHKLIVIKEERTNQIDREKDKTNRG